MYCIKATSKRSSLSGGSRRGGIVGEAAWEVKKSAGGGECRKRLLTPSSRIDTFLRATCFSASWYVRDAPRMSISRLAGCSSYTRATCILYFVFPSRRTRGDRAGRLPTDEISMKGVCRAAFQGPRLYSPILSFDSRRVSKCAYECILIANVLKNEPA